jgi:hypothetical protein
MWMVFDEFEKFKVGEKYGVFGIFILSYLFYLIRM